MPLRKGLFHPLTRRGVPLRFLRPPANYVLPVAGLTYEDLVRITPGQIGYWPLSELSGNIAFDRVGQNNGVYTAVAGATPAARGQAGPIDGDPATAALFDGVDDYVAIPHKASLNVGDGPFTIDYWIKMTGLGGTYREVAHKGVGAWATELNPSNKFALVRPGTADDTWESVVVNDTTTFHYVAFTSDRHGYFDGEDKSDLVGDASLIDNVFTDNTSPIHIGASVTPNNFIGATIANVSLVGAVLSRDQVALRYMIGRGMFPWLNSEGPDEQIAEAG